MEGLGVSEGVMAIIPPIIRGTEGHRVHIRCSRSSEEKHGLLSLRWRWGLAS